MRLSWKRLLCEPIRDDATSKAEAATSGRLFQYYNIDKLSCLVYINM